MANHEMLIASLRLVLWQLRINGLSNGAKVVEDAIKELSKDG